MITWARSSKRCLLPAPKEATTLISAPCPRPVHYTTARRGCAASRVLSAAASMVAWGRSSSRPQTRCFILSSYAAALPTHELFYLIFSPSCQGGRVRERLCGHLAANQAQPTTHIHTCLLLFQVGVCRPSGNCVLPRVRGQLAAQHWRRVPKDWGLLCPRVPKGSAWLLHEATRGAASP